MNQSFPLLAIGIIVFAIDVAVTLKRQKRCTSLRNVTAYTNRETGETFVWMYDDNPASVRKLVQHLGVTAADPELWFGWMQANELSRIVLTKAGAMKAEDAA